MAEEERAKMVHLPKAWETIERTFLYVCFLNDADATGKFRGKGWAD